MSAISDFMSAGTALKKPAAAAGTSALLTELLIQPDGTVLVHNLTPIFADLLLELGPQDEQIQPRAARMASACDPGPAADH